MAVRNVIFLASVFLVQVIAAQKFGLNGPGHSFGPPNSRIPVTSGGGFEVTSFSPISATGLSVVSQNVIEGPLAVGGQLPFQGAVSFESKLPTRGTAAVNYCCGNQQVGINQLLPNPGIGTNYAGKSIGVPGISVPGLAGPAFTEPVLSRSAPAGPNLSGLYLSGPGLVGPVLPNQGLSGVGLVGPGLLGPAPIRPILAGPVNSEPVLYRSVTGPGTQLCPDCAFALNRIY